MTERIKGGLISIGIAQIREERVDIFGLVVGPDCRIIAFPARAVHQAAFRTEDTFSSANLGLPEHFIQDRIRGVEDKIGAQSEYKCLTCSKFRIHVRMQRRLRRNIPGHRSCTCKQRRSNLAALTICLINHSKRKFLAGSHPRCHVTVNFRTDKISSVHTSIMVRRCCLTELRNCHQKIVPCNIFQRKSLIDSRKRSGRKYGAGHPDTSRFHSARSDADEIIGLGPKARNLDHSVNTY